jgi:hypothetical protein
MSDYLGCGSVLCEVEIPTKGYDRDCGMLPRSGPCRCFTPKHDDHLRKAWWKAREELDALRPRVKQLEELVEAYRKENVKLGAQVEAFEANNDE